MHEDLFKELEETIQNGIPDNIVDAAPRGNAKSTLVSFALVLWCALYRKKHYIIIVSDTASQADDFLINIKTELEENEYILSDFGRQEGHVWTNSDIVTVGDVRVQALGTGKRIRGRRYKQWRPDLIICDDLENDENVASPEQRKKDESWFLRALSKAGDERTDKVVIGTILHYDSLLAKLLKNPIYVAKIYKSVISWSKSPKWFEWEKIVTNLEDVDRLEHARAFYEANKEEMLQDTKVLWPEKEDYYSLMLQRVAEGPAAFSSEKQNEPLSEQDMWFHPDWFQYYDDNDIAGKDLYVVSYIDPSMGKIKGDFYAICTIGMDSNYIIYVLDFEMGRVHPDTIITSALAKHEFWEFRKLGVEEVQFQEYFKDNMKKKAAEEGVSINIVGVKQHSDKLLRIESLQPDIRNGRIKFRRSQRDLIEQLIQFPSAAHDDGPDALEGAKRLLGKRSGVADFYKEKANEANRSDITTIINNPNLQRIG